MAMVMVLPDSVSLEGSAEGCVIRSGAAGALVRLSRPSAAGRCHCRRCPCGCGGWRTCRRCSCGCGGSRTDRRRSCGCGDVAGAPPSFSPAWPLAGSAAVDRAGPAYLGAAVRSVPVHVRHAFTDHDADDGGAAGAFCAVTGPEPVLLAEGFVDLQQDLLLPLVQRRVREDDRTRLHLVPVPLGVEDAGADVQRLGGDPQRLGDLLQHLRTRLAQPALDLAQIRIGHPGGIGELPQRQLRVAPLLAQVVTEIADVERCHASTVPHLANYCKHPLAKVRHATRLALAA